MALKTGADLRHGRDQAFVDEGERLRPRLQKLPGEGFGGGFVAGNHGLLERGEVDHQLQRLSPDRKNVNT